MTFSATSIPTSWNAAATAALGNLFGCERKNILEWPLITQNYFLFWEFTQTMKQKKQNRRKKSKYITLVNQNNSKRCCVYISLPPTFLAARDVGIAGDICLFHNLKQFPSVLIIYLWVIRLQIPQTSKIKDDEDVFSPIISCHVDIGSF